MMTIFGAVFAAGRRFATLSRALRKEAVMAPHLSRAPPAEETQHIACYSTGSDVPIAWPRCVLRPSECTLLGRVRIASAAFAELRLRWRKDCGKVGSGWTLCRGRYSTEVPRSAQFTLDMGVFSSSSATKSPSPPRPALCRQESDALLVILHFSNGAQRRLTILTAHRVTFFIHIWHALAVGGRCVGTNGHEGLTFIP